MMLCAAWLNDHVVVNFSLSGKSRLLVRRGMSPPAHVLDR
jgi:hypothetical protein